MRMWSPEQWALVLGGVTTIIAGISTAAVKIIIALKGVEHKVDALEVKVDGRLTQLLERTALASRAEGVTVGRGEVAGTPAAPEAPPAPVALAGDELVIGIPIPTPPILLVPVEGEIKPVEGESKPDQ